jgi:hypothetical protein
VPVALDVVTLRSAIFPQEVSPLLLDVAAALAGVEGKIAPIALEDLGASPRGRLTAGVSGQPLLVVVNRLATMLGLARPEVVVGADVKEPRPVVLDGFWLVVPEGLVSQPEPVQAAAIMGPLVRMALRVPWLDDLPGAYAHATLCGAVRQVIPDYGSEIGGVDQQDLIEEMTKRVAKAIGRKQKKALQELVPALEATHRPAPADVQALERAVARTGMRAAFVAGGDLLACVEALRASDPQLAKATVSVGAGALAAILTHAVAGDLARFALAPTTTALRWRAGSLWRPSR